MRSINADKRLTQVSFITGRDWLTHPPSFYTCPMCSTELAFFMRDFARHDRSAFTNLSLTDAEAITNFVQAYSSQVWDSFLDFYCPGCNLPIRIYYLADELVGSPRRAYGYSLQFVIEHDSQK
jgi:hypothetical protein